MTTIVTHNRFFNLDEIAAIALLDIFHLKGNYDLIRTRDNDKLSHYIKDENTFVLDVGFVYNSNMKNFDHHQKSLTEKWDTGESYSSCGLIWKWLKENNFVSSFSNNEIMSFEKNFIKKVDLQDNAVKYFNAMNFVSASNRKHFDDAVIDQHFIRTLKIVKGYIENLILSIKSKEKDLYANNYKITNKSLFIGAAILIRYYAFDKKFKEVYNENVIEFHTTDKYGEPLIYKIDEDTQTFFINDIVIGNQKSLVMDVWDFYKKSNRLTQKMDQDTVSLMENYFVNLFVSGQTANSLSYYFTFERAKKDQKTLFFVMTNYFMNTFAFIRSEIVANKALNKFIKKSENLNGIVFCDVNIKNVMKKINSICQDKKIVIIPRDKNSWTVQFVSKSLSMPKHWCGLKDKKLQDISNNKNLIFCHNTGFMCMFKGSKEDVISFAQSLIS